MKTCVVVLNYNDSKRTLQYISDIKNYKILDEIVIVDNNSTDDSLKELKKIKNTNVTVLQAEKNKGYGAGNNIGCKYLNDKYENPIIFISNPDIIVKENTFKEIKKVLIENNDVAIAAPIVNQDGGQEKGWRLLTPLRGAYLNLPFVYRRKKRNRNVNYFYNEDDYKEEVTYVDVVTGCFFAIKGQEMKEIKYFDEDVFLYNEEEIIAKKLKNIGKRTVVVNSEEVIHEHSVSINKRFSNLKKIKLANKSRILYQKKYNNANLVEVLIWRLVNGISLLKESAKIIIKK